jgi:hypothetical protein
VRLQDWAAQAAQATLPAERPGAFVFVEMAQHNDALVFMLLLLVLHERSR